MKRNAIFALIAAFPLTATIPSIALADVASIQLTCTGLSSGTCTISGQGSAIAGQVRTMANFIWEGTNVAVTQTSQTAVSYICNTNGTTGLSIIKAYLGIDLDTGKEPLSASVFVCPKS